jgi:hypothetical protein
MAETPIVSESLQKDFRDNFPSQVSSGRDLHVSDVVVPIVDFSTTVGTTGLTSNLQQALAFGNQTTYEVRNATTTVTSTPGFYRCFGSMVQLNNSIDTDAYIGISDGSTTKQLFGYDNNGYLTTNRLDYELYDFIFFLSTGDSFIVSSSVTNFVWKGSIRQLADISGTLVNPTGYTGS